MTPEGDRHLVLVGLMGSGKSTVGSVCAARLGRAFVDTDDLIEATTGRSVAHIFDVDGEAVFRELERRAIADVCDSPEPLVIACGGGAIVDAMNRQRLRDHGIVVWLRAAPAVLAARVGDTGATRPLLRSGEPQRQLERLAEVRNDAYTAAAHVTVDTDGRTVEQVADAIIEEVTRCNA